MRRCGVDTDRALLFLFIATERNHFGGEVYLCREPGGRLGTACEREKYLAVDALRVSAPL